MPITDYNRKYAIRLLNGPRPEKRRQQRRGKRGLSYSRETLAVLTEIWEAGDSFPFGPYPADKVTYRSQSMVEYETPANADGLGTGSKLRKNANAIGGAAILVRETPDLVHLAVRLSPEMSGLASAVIKQLEHDAKQGDN